MRYDWEKLSRQQVGAFAEYFVKMELTMYGIQVYSSEVDDRGVDFVARNDTGPYFSIQVKSFREKGYVFVQKDKFDLSSDMYLALAQLNQGVEPNLYLIPSLSWKKPNELIVDHDYIGKKSKPEWGLNLSLKNLPMLEKYSIENTISQLISIKIP
jgi:hypothetical protein